VRPAAPRGPAHCQKAGAGIWRQEGVPPAPALTAEGAPSAAGVAAALGARQQQQQQQLQNPHLRNRFHDGDDGAIYKDLCCEFLKSSLLFMPK